MSDDQVMVEAERKVKNGALILVLSGCLLFFCYQLLKAIDPNKFLVVTTFLMGLGGCISVAGEAIGDEAYKVVREHGVNPAIRLFAVVSHVAAIFASIFFCFLVIGA